MIRFTIHPKFQSGYGRSAQEVWEIQSEAPLSDAQIRAAIELHKPSAGYGESYWSRMEPNRVQIKSWASAD